MIDRDEEGGGDCMEVSLNEWEMRKERNWWVSEGSKKGKFMWPLQHIHSTHDRKKNYRFCADGDKRPHSDVLLFAPIIL